MQIRNLFSLLLKSAATLVAAGIVCEAQVYHPMFDGKTLKGWHVQGAGSWKVANGLIEGTHTSDGDHGHLVSDTSFTNFRMHFRWKLSPGGNSGLYIRAQEGGAGGMIGAQLEMDETYSGGIYSTATNPWGWIYQVKAEDAKKWYKPADWNDMTIIVNKSNATNTQNGLPTMNVTSTALGTEGHLGFQVHAGLNMTLWLKDLEWSEVPGSTSVVNRLILNAAGGANRITLPAGFTRAEVYNLSGRRLWSGHSEDASLALPMGMESGVLKVRLLP